MAGLGIEPRPLEYVPGALPLSYLAIERALLKKAQL
jgi:hypothetical protein